MHVSVAYFFLLSNSIPLYDYITFYLPIHSLVDFWVFPFPTVINSSATHIHVQVFVSIYVSFLLGMSGISGSYGEFIFNFSRNCQTVFQNSCTILYFFSHSSQHWFVPFCFLFVSSVSYFFFSAFPLITYTFFKNSILIYFTNEHLSTHTHK